MGIVRLDRSAVVLLTRALPVTKLYGTFLIFSYVELENFLGLCLDYNV